MLSKSVPPPPTGFMSMSESTSSNSTGSVTWRSKKLSIALKLVNCMTADLSSAYTTSRASSSTDALVSTTNHISSTLYDSVSLNAGSRNSLSEYLLSTGLKL